MEKKQFDNEGKLSVWAKTSAKGANYYSGTVTINKVVYNVTFFDNDKATSEKSPVFTGSVKVREDR